MKNFLIPASLIGIGLILISGSSKKPIINSEIEIKRNEIIQDFNSLYFNQNAKNAIINAVKQFSNFEILVFYDFYITNKADCNSSSNANCGKDIEAIYRKYDLIKYFNKP